MMETAGAGAGAHAPMVTIENNVLNTKLDKKKKKETDINGK
jgi:hypothetical protein